MRVLEAARRLFGQDCGWRPGTIYELPTPLSAARRVLSDEKGNTMPSALFVCVHNAGRSQMAAGFQRALSGGAVEVRSAGSMPADRLNPVAVQAMAEKGIDIADEK